MRRSGYSLIEILVVLVLLGLVAGVAVPNVMAMFDSYERNNIVRQLSSRLADLPLEARAKQTTLVFSNSDELGIELTGVKFVPPLKVEQNGYCHESSLVLTKYNETNSSEAQLRFTVSSPFCMLLRVP